MVVEKRRALAQRDVGVLVKSRGKHAPAVFLKKWLVIRPASEKRQTKR
jgi:hypothetical protein